MSSLVLTPARGAARSAALPVLLAGLVLSCLAAVLLADGTTLASWAYLSLSVGGASVAWVGDRRRPQNRRGPVPWVPLTLTCNAVGDVLWQALSWSAGSAPDVSVADLAWLSSYVAMGGIAMTGRINGRSRPGARLYAALDGCAVLVVALLLVFQTSITTTLAEHGLPLLTRATFIAYPVLDAVLIGLMAWRLVLHGRVRPTVALLLLGMSC